MLSPDAIRYFHIQLTTNRAAAGGRPNSIFIAASAKCTTTPSAPHALTHIIILVLQVTENH